MAEYIDRNLIEWYGCNYENSDCENRECSGCSHAECLHSQVMQIPTADVVERSEYEKLRLVNLDLAETNKGLLAEHEQLLKLRSKIDKAREEIEELATEQIQVYDEENPYISGVVEYVSLTEVRELLDELIESENKETNPYKDFCKFVAEIVLEDDFEDNAGANAEILCRKLSKLGIVKADGNEWVLAGSEE